MFKQQMGEEMEVYIDDMLVKSKSKGHHLKVLSNTFETLDHYRMKLNESKFSFGIQLGKFLGYLVTKRGIEATLNQIEAINNTLSLKTLR